MKTLPLNVFTHRKLYLIAVFTLLISFVIPGIGMAKPRDGDIKFKKLDPQLKNKQLTINYEINHKAWKFLNKRSIVPDMVIRIAPPGKKKEFHFVYSFKIKSKNGFLTLPADIKVKDRSKVDIKLVAFQKGWRIKKIKYNEIERQDMIFVVNDTPPPPPKPRKEWYLSINNQQIGPLTSKEVEKYYYDRKINLKSWVWRVGLTNWARLSTTPAFQHLKPHKPLPPPKVVNWATKPKVIRACGDIFSGQNMENRCLDTVASSKFNPAKMIQTCADSMDGDTNELECIIAALEFQRDPSKQIRACEQAMDGDTNELKCIRLIQKSRIDITKAIQECEAAMEGDTNELACIRFVSRTNSDPTSIIRACEASMGGDSSELQCIERGTSR